MTRVKHYCSHPLLSECYTSFEKKEENNAFLFAFYVGAAGHVCLVISTSCIFHYI